MVENVLPWQGNGNRLMHLMRATSRLLQQTPPKLVVAQLFHLHDADLFPK